MRLWHYELLSALPQKQLCSQWRECCAIAKSIAEKGTPNHILVNRIMDYPIDEFYTYCYYVMDEMRARGYKCNPKKFYENMYKLKPKGEPYNLCVLKKIFKDWHNDTYLRQCYHNLEEKYYCGGISPQEFGKVFQAYAGKYDYHFETHFFDEKGEFLI